MVKKKPAKFIPKLRTPQTIAEENKRSVQEVLSVIFLNNIIPFALADDIPVLSSEQEKLIVASLPKRARKIN